jgi:hypothetical protein
MGTIAKWSIRGMPAAAKTDCRSAAKPKWLAILIENLKFALDA